MAPRDTSRKPPRPLDERRLEELAVSYVGRFATTRARLGAYLGRKLRERGWEGKAAPATEALVERLAGLGYIDDAAYALSKARSLGQRGYGGGRVTMALRTAGIGEDDGRAAQDFSREQSVAAAVRFAQRRRIGPFAMEKGGPEQRQKALAAMVRAGHAFELARAIVALEPDRSPDPEEIADRLSYLQR